MLISLWTSLAHAGLNDPYDPDNPGLLIPGLAAVGGLVIILFSKARAEQQGARLSMAPEDAGVKAFTWIYRLMGLALTGFGIAKLVA